MPVQLSQPRIISLAVPANRRSVAIRRAAATEAIHQVPESDRQIASADRCPHGEEIHNDVPYCGICCGAGDDVAGFELFQYSLYDLCYRVARKVWSGSILINDRQHDAYLAILQNLKNVIRARDPYAMARTIAERRLINVTKRAMNQNEIPVSRLTLGQEDDGLSISEKLESLAGDEDNVFAKPGQPSRLTYFPGARTLWKPQYLSLLEISLDKAFARLPTEPVSQSVAVKLWFGMYEECGELTYEQIAKQFNLSERHARYQVQEGISNLRRFMEEEASNMIRRAKNQVTQIK